MRGTGTTAMASAIRFSHRSASSRLNHPSRALVSHPRKTQRAQGTPDAMRTRSLVRNGVSTRVSHHRHAEQSGVPCAVVLTVSFVLFLATGLCCHHRRRDTSRRLDASVGASEPHDFTVRAARVRPRAIGLPACASSRPPHPAPHVRDDRDTPLLARRDGADVKLIWGRRWKRNISCPGAGQGLVICPTGITSAPKFEMRRLARYIFRC